MDVEVRAATLADYPGVARVAHEVHEYHVALAPDIFRGVDVVMPETYFAELVAGEDSEVVVAECDEVIAGYAVLMYFRATLDVLVPRTFAVVDNLGVAEAYRRHGIGRRLMAACVAQARDRGATNLELTVWEANQDALAFYFSLGLRTQRRRLAMEI